MNNNIKFIYINSGLNLNSFQKKMFYFINLSFIKTQMVLNVSSIYNDDKEKRRK